LATKPDYLQQVVSHHRVQRGHAPVVEQEDVNAGELQQPFGKAAVAVQDAQFFIQSRYA
jgi:hypothetical protein